MKTDVGHIKVEGLGLVVAAQPNYPPVTKDDVSRKYDVIRSDFHDERMLRARQRRTNDRQL